MWAIFGFIESGHPIISVIVGYLIFIASGLHLTKIIVGFLISHLKWALQHIVYRWALLTLVIVGSLFI